VDFQNYQKACDAGFLARTVMPQIDDANRFSDWRAMAMRREWKARGQLRHMKMKE
jgi:hypothetical protein